VTTLTISNLQYEYARQKITAEGLASRVDVQLRDYRDLRGTYDKIVSIEMLEAVGHRFLPVFFRKCHEVLKPHGALGLQVITCPDGRYEALRRGVDWIQKHIFPGSLLPSIAAINAAVNKTGDMILHDLEPMGVHYARTLATWRENFNRRWEAVRALGFDETFRRKWNYYLSYCEAAFAMRHITVLQMIYTRPDNPHF
jgi:cyclopropane-fatty-acyl-phospholipid synthase